MNSVAPASWSAPVLWRFSPSRSPVPQASSPASSGGVSPHEPIAGARTPRNSQARTPEVRGGGASARCPRSAGFQTCCIADFQIGRSRGVSGAREQPGRCGWPDGSRVWKPAIQQTWKSALHAGSARMRVSPPGRIAGARTPRNSQARTPAVHPPAARSRARRLAMTPPSPPVC